MKIFKLALAVVFALVAASAYSASLFSDDFNRPAGNTVGKGWTETPVADVSIVKGGHPNNAMRLKGNPNSGRLLDVIATHLNIDATGFDTIVFSFDWKGLQDNERAPLDKLYAAYSIDGINWLNLTPKIMLQDDYWVHATYSLSPGGDNQANLGIRFATVVNNNSDGVRIDNVSVTGMSAVSAVPEPETYAMMMAGLGLLGFMGRRGKQNEAAGA